VKGGFCGKKKIPHGNVRARSGGRVLPEGAHDPLDRFFITSKNPW